MRPRFVLLCVLVTFSASSAHAASYSVTRVADLSSDYAPLISDGPSINNSGSIAFEGKLASGTGIGVYRTDGGITTTILAPSFYSATAGQPSINDSGVVAFSVTLPATGAAVVTGTGGPLTTITSGAQLYGPFVSLSNNGNVAYFAQTGLTNDSILVSKGGPATPIVVNSTLSNTLFIHADPVISKDGGSVLYQWVDDAAGSGHPLGLFVHQGAATQTLVAPFTINTFSNYRINDSGQVAFIATMGNGFGVFEGSGSSYAPIVLGPSLANPFSQWSIATGATVALNDLGNVAFTAGYGGVAGIFTGPDPVANKLIGVGDPLDGSTIKSLQIGPEALNDHGQVAFWAQLNDGRDGMYLASPVPEPGSMSLTLAAIASLTVTTAWRRRRLHTTITPQG